jgi:hypothetical protein
LKLNEQERRERDKDALKIIRRTELEAIADPHPKVLNLLSVTTPFSSTLICSFITSPQAGAPTKPVPTSSAALSREPTFLGFS